MKKKKKKRLSGGLPSFYEILSSGKREQKREKCVFAPFGEKRKMKRIETNSFRHTHKHTYTPPQAIPNYHSSPL